MRFLAGLADSPATPAALTAAQVEDYVQWRGRTTPEFRLAREVRSVFATLTLLPPGDAVSAEVGEAFTRRWAGPRAAGRAGYSDRELAALLSAARTDVTALRDRIRGGEEVLARLQSGAATAQEKVLWHWLESMASDGIVPRSKQYHTGLAQRRDWAGALFLTWPDLAALLTLLVTATGRNIETIKELPVEHRVIEGRAVELQLTKRRRGAGRWTETVTWEVGPPHRELHTPGGLYLLLHRLCARGRAFSGSNSSVWSLWRNGGPSGAKGSDELFDPFARSLHGGGGFTAYWHAAHELFADGPDGVEEDARVPLRLDFIRLKTSIDVRRTRQMGGHLPSSVRSNTMAVMFSNYLRDDPTTVEWAAEVVGDALIDAERAALDAHQRALQATGGGQELATTRTDELLHDGPSADSGWANCADPQHHPATGAACRTSFLDCFSCGNAVVTPGHLPRLMALLDSFARRRQQLGEQEWWARYGPAWAAIRHDVLPKFSPAEISRATADKPFDGLLDLVENPWGHG